MPTPRRSYDGVLAALRASAGVPDLEWRRPPEPVSDSVTAEIVRVELEGDGYEGTYALRILKDSRSYSREVTAHRTAANGGVDTPQIHLASGPTNTYDRGWILMDYVDGGFLIDGSSRWDYIRALPRLMRIPEVLADVAAKIHAVDITYADTSLGTGDTAGAALGWIHSDAASLGDGDLQKRCEVLLYARPRVGEVALVHSNLHPLNVISTADRTVVVDWARAQLDDPHYDIAAAALVMRVAPTRMRRVAPGLVRNMSDRMVSRFLRRYETASGRTLDPKRLDWFEGLVATRVLLEATLARRAAGGTLEEGYELMEPVLRARYSPEVLMARLKRG